MYIHIYCNHRTCLTNQSTNCMFIIVYQIRIDFMRAVLQKNNNFILFDVQLSSSIHPREWYEGTVYLYTPKQ